MDITKDIQAMTTFRNNSARFLRHLQKTKRALILTVNGKAAAVVQDAEAYQDLLDRVETIEALHRGFADVDAHRTKPARTVLNRCATRTIV